MNLPSEKETVLGCKGVLGGIGVFRGVGLF
jgi:hypothetical protein